MRSKSLSTVRGCLFRLTSVPFYSRQGVVIDHCNPHMNTKKKLDMGDVLTYEADLLGMVKEVSAFQKIIDSGLSYKQENAINLHQCVLIIH